jgi:hypothetical protein
MISGEVRSTPSGSIGAISLSRLHAEASSAPRTPASNIVEERCVAAAATKEPVKEQGETIPPQCGSSRRSTMMDDVVLRPPRGHDHVINEYNNQLLLYARGLHR